MSISCPRTTAPNIIITPCKITKLANIYPNNYILIISDRHQNSRNVKTLRNQIYQQVLQKSNRRILPEFQKGSLRNREEHLVRELQQNTIRNFDKRIRNATFECRFQFVDEGVEVAVDSSVNSISQDWITTE